MKLVIKVIRETLHPCIANVVCVRSNSKGLHAHPGLGWIVWAWSRSVEIPLSLTFFQDGVGAQCVPQKAWLLTVVATPPVLHNSVFSVQHLAAKHAVEGRACCKDAKSSSAAFW